MSSPEPGAKTGASSSPPAVEVADLRKKFGDLEVLKGVSLTAGNGDVVAIIGGSGSGKSTLLRCINMLELPTSGAISIRGETIEMKPDGRDGLRPGNAAQLRRIRTRLAMVFQSFNLWQHMTVLGNVIEAPVQVMGVPRDEAIARAEKLLERVGLSDKRDVYPAFLSGGQQQRAAIARALAVSPKLLICDEAVSALDVSAQTQVLRLLAKIRQEMQLAIIFISHDLGVVRQISDRVAVMYFGEIVELEATDDVFERPSHDYSRRLVSAALDLSFDGSAEGEQ